MNVHFMPPQTCRYPHCGRASSMSPCRPTCAEEYARDHPAPPEPPRCVIDYGRMGDAVVVCETHGVPFFYYGKVRRCPVGKLEDQLCAFTKGKSA